MSASIAAAQRRRAGPPDTGRPGGGPKPSINSAQAFHGQSLGQSASGMPRPNMPTGKLAGQHAAQQQAMDRQQYAANQKAQAMQGEPDFSKITVAQAITLITLRLGKLETSMYKLQMESELGGSANNVRLEGLEDSNLKLVDGSVIDSIVARLESLEKRGTGGVGNSQEVATLKQQVDLIKPSIVTLKNASITNTKDIKELNNQLTAMFEEISVLKAELQGLYSSNELMGEEEAEAEEQATSLEDLQVDLASELVATNGKLDLTDLTM